MEGKTPFYTILKIFVSVISIFRGMNFFSYCSTTSFVHKIKYAHYTRNAIIFFYILHEKQRQQPPPPPSPQQQQQQLLLINGQFITLYLCDYILCVSTLGKWLKSMWKCLPWRDITTSQSIAKNNSNNNNHKIEKKNSKWLNTNEPASARMWRQRWKKPTKITCK